MRGRLRKTGEYQAVVASGKTDSTVRATRRFWALRDVSTESDQERRVPSTRQGFQDRDIIGAAQMKITG